MSELRFTGSVNMKSRTAVFKFSLVLSRELEAQMLLELLGELQSINHRNEAKKSELGSIGKKSWVRAPPMFFSYCCVSRKHKVTTRGDS